MKKDTIIVNYSTKGPGKRGHIVADTNVSPFARARNMRADTNFVSAGHKNVSDFVQKQFVSATNVSQFAQPKKHHEQQCVRNNVSSFASTLTEKSKYARKLFA